jgi:hypothetical protein
MKKTGKSPRGLSEAERKIRLVIHCDPAVAEAIKELSVENSRTVSQEIERIARQYARQCGKIQ